MGKNLNARLEVLREIPHIRKYWISFAGENLQGGISRLQLLL